MAGTGAPGGHGPTVDSKAQFLAAVEEMAMNALATVAAYNAEIKDGVGLNPFWMPFLPKMGVIYQPKMGWTTGVGKCPVLGMLLNKWVGNWKCWVNLPNDS